MPHNMIVNGSVMSSGAIPSAGGGVQFAERLEDPLAFGHLASADGRAGRY